MDEEMRKAFEEVWEENKEGFLWLADKDPEKMEEDE